MDAEIWVSEAPLRSENVKLTLSNLVPAEGNFDESFRLAKRSAEENMLGTPLSEDNFPKHIYSDSTSKGKKQTFGDIFVARKFLVISDAAARVLQAFDLGCGALYPVRLTGSDKETPQGEGWHCLNFGNAKETIIPEQPIGLMRVDNPDRTLFVLGGYMKPGQLAVQRGALAGPDIWVDPRMLLGFFVSGRLASAIKRAKLTGFYLTRCTLV